MIRLIKWLFRRRRQIITVRASHKAQREADRKRFDKHDQLAHELGREWKR